jgi:hypothetical protein
MLLWFELGLSIAAVLLAIYSPGLGSAFLGTAERTFTRLAHRQRLSLLAVGVLALASRAAVLPVLPVPEPRLNDEFSHLLLADTLAHSRLTNPTPPMWIHFETFHVIMRPTYASMYPPAQGVSLALGQALGRQPFLGVCLSVAIMCTAICWMLQGWFSPGWALLGGLIAVARLGVFSYWADSYWGGAMAATGGALVLGALRRIMRSERRRDALLMGIGLAILANSRPYEGLIFSLPAAAALFIWFVRRKGPSFSTSIRRVIVPLSLALVLAAGATGYYCWRVTGNPFRLPQQVDRDTYAVAPYFLWQSPRPEPVYHHKELRDFYLHNELNFYLGLHNSENLISALIVRTVQLWCFYLGPALTLPLLLSISTLPLGFRAKRCGWDARFLLLAGMVSIAGLAVEVFFFPHYAAPMTCLIFAFLLMAMRRLRRWEWRGRPIGVSLTRAVPVICLVMLVLRAGAAPLHLSLAPDWPPTWYNLPPVKTDRARIQAVLDRQSGEHLVIVRYQPQSQSKYDWVYNEADIESAKIVWARDMGRAANRELIDYFNHRHAWLVEPDEAPPKLSPYQAQPNANEGGPHDE